MSPSRRAAFLALVGAAALAVPGPPASAAPSPTQVPTAVATAAPTVTKVAGITQLDAPLADTPSGRVLFDSRSGGRAPLSARATLTVDLASAVTVPTDATAAVLTVTSVAATTAGWLTAWPADRNRPTASTLNFAPGTATPNLAVVRMSADRRIKVYNGSGGRTHVLVALQGWIRSNAGTSKPGSLTVAAPARVIDTRTTATPIPAKGYRDVTVTGRGAPAGASAALLDVISVKPTRAGYLIAHPSDTPRPTSTALTYRVGTDRAGLSVFRLSSTGKIRLWNMSSAPVHVVLDSFGWAAGGDASRTPMATRALTPQRVLDTREAVGPLRSANGWETEIPLPSEDPARGLGTPTAYVLSVTATGATRGGHLQLDVRPDDDPMDVSSTPSFVNFGVDQTVTNTTYVAAPTDRRLRIQAVTPGSVHVVVDLVGVVTHEWQVDGRIVEEGTGTPVHPAALGPSARFTDYAIATVPGGAFSQRGNDPAAVSALCAAPVNTAGTAEDLRYVPDCLRDGRRNAVVRHVPGAITVVGDLSVPRAGSLSGSVVGPTGSLDSRPTVVLSRADGRFDDIVNSTADGTWTNPRLPVGDWVVTVFGVGGWLTGEVVHDLPTPTSSSVMGGPNLVAAGATTFRVSAGAPTDVGEVVLKRGGTLWWTVEDPDGNADDVTVTIRHTSGLEVLRSIRDLEASSILRPSSYTVCGTEDSATRCSGGGTSHETATPVVVEADATTRVTLTMP